ncbi:hypothetical protein DFH09DRAFT_1413432 [Mycena vulgaris]|nr:hypothetical protein DFH09DRAFT_1413432 [Mycena vulgaris]
MALRDRDSQLDFCLSTSSLIFSFILSQFICASPIPVIRSHTPLVPWLHLSGLFCLRDRYPCARLTHIIISAQLLVNSKRLSAEGMESEDLSCAATISLNPVSTLWASGEAVHRKVAARATCAFSAADAQRIFPPAFAPSALPLFRPRAPHPTSQLQQRQCQRLECGNAERAAPPATRGGPREHGRHGRGAHPRARRTSTLTVSSHGCAMAEAQAVLAGLPLLPAHEDVSAEQRGRDGERAEATTQKTACECAGPTRGTGGAAGGGGALHLARVGGAREGESDARHGEGGHEERAEEDDKHVGEDEDEGEKETDEEEWEDDVDFRVEAAAERRMWAKRELVVWEPKMCLGISPAPAPHFEAHLARVAVRSR